MNNVLEVILLCVVVLHYSYCAEARGGERNFTIAEHVTVASGSKTWRKRDSEREEKACEAIDDDLCEAIACKVKPGLRPRVSRTTPSEAKTQVLIENISLVEDQNPDHSSLTVPSVYQTWHSVPNSSWWLLREVPSWFPADLR